MPNESKQKYNTEYKDLKFKNEVQFKKWLGETATYVIEFEDNGQDCLKWWIDNGGEVLHSRMQSNAWNGMIVDLTELVIGNDVGVMDVEEQQTVYYDFIVKKITKL